MRRKAVIFISLLLFITSALSAKVTYQPSISVIGGGTFTYKTEDLLRSSFSVRAEVDPIAINFNEHTLSFPISYTYVSRTPYFEGYCLNSHMDFGLGIAYRYDFNNVFTLKSMFDVQLRYIHEVHGGIFSMGFTAEPAFYVSELVTVGFPVRMGFSKKEFNISPSLAITVLPFGGMK